MTAADVWDISTPAGERHGKGVDLVEQRPAVVPGGSFIFDEGQPVPAKWGHDDAPLWAEGESLVITGPTGVGKSTLAQRVVLAQLGMAEASVLGLPVAPLDGRVLYIAADRPRQIARSFRCMVAEHQRTALDDRLVIRQGPLPFDVVKEPWRLSVFAQQHGSSQVVVDSLKDIAMQLSSDETGGAVNQAFQHCLAAGVDVLCLHHNRKGTAENPRPKALADVYGSAWLASGAGSVVALWAPEAGSPMVDVLHLKQPAREVGPLRALVDITAGTFTVTETVDLLAMLRGAPRGITATTAAVAIYGTPEPSRSNREKARRQLEALRRGGYASKDEGEPRPGGGTPESIYYATTEAAA